MAKAKPDLRARAVELRLEGRSYREIAEVVPVSKSTLSLWLRDLPLTDDHRASLDGRHRTGARSRADAIRAARTRRVQVLQAAAAAEIGELTERELFLLGVAAYWCEGTKAKPWSPAAPVAFINSDPTLITLFLRWLDALGYERSDHVYRVSIHESADVDRATASWADVVGVPPERFRRPTLKRHNPASVRRIDEDVYVGCLIVNVRRSTDLNRRIAGWWSGIAAGLG
jgi:transposase-like protein